MWFLRLCCRWYHIWFLICLSLFFRQIRSPIGCDLFRLIWGLQILWSSLLSHGWLARPLAHDESGFLSHLLDKRHSMYGITWSSDKPAYCPKCLRYSAGFGAWDPLVILALFPWFPDFPCDRALEAFPSWGVLSYVCANCASEATSISGFEPPNCHFYAMHSPHGPTVSILWPKVLVAPC